jgi:hypothetical protein
MDKNYTSNVTSRLERVIHLADQMLNCSPVSQELVQSYVMAQGLKLGLSVTNNTALFQLLAETICKYKSQAGRGRTLTSNT